MLPERPISGALNLVTLEGFSTLQTQLEEARTAYEAASRIEDINERRRASARPLRDFRYFAERLRTARPVEPPSDNATIAFGHTVTFRREDGRTQTYRIVGEDEADPGEGSIAYTSPIAKGLMGKSAGDVVILGGRALEIICIA